MRHASIIIVNWNTGELLAKCLASIVRLPEAKRIRHVVIVDNASTDTSLAKARAVASEHGYIFLEQSVNKGFAKANAIGLAYIRAHGGEDDDILLLNPDTEVFPHALSNMLDLFNARKDTGIIGPKLLEKTGETQASVRAFPTLGIFILLFLKMHRLLFSLPFWKRYMQIDFDYEKEASVDQVMGAAFLIRNELLKQIGFLDTAFWIWFEEVDYCKRAKDAKWDVLYTPEALVMHYQGASFHQLVGLRKTKPFLASSLVYAKKHLGVFSYTILLALYPAAIFIASLASIAHRAKRRENTKRL